MHRSIMEEFCPNSQELHSATSVVIVYSALKRTSASATGTTVYHIMDRPNPGWNHIKLALTPLLLPL